MLTDSRIDQILTLRPRYVRHARRLLAVYEILGIDPMTLFVPDQEHQMEYGHNHSHGSLNGELFTDVWGSGPFVITAADDRSYRFEDSERFGPALLKQNDELKADPWPPEKSPFWLAHRLWRKQGRRVADDGKTCFVDLTLRPTVLRRMSGKHHLVVTAGDEDGGYVYEDEL